MRLPESFRRSYQAYVDGRVVAEDLPVELGGTVVPPSLRWAIQEFVLGANPAVHMYTCGYSFAHTMLPHGTPDQQALGALVATTAGAGRWC